MGKATLLRRTGSNTAQAWLVGVEGPQGHEDGLVGVASGHAAAVLKDLAACVLAAETEIVAFAVPVWKKKKKQC
jgi:hypothetical protein